MKSLYLNLILFLLPVIAFSQGSNWFSQSPPPFSNRLIDICIINETNAVAVGDYGIIIKTINGGIAWEVKSSGTSNNLYSVYFADENTGWAVGQSGKIIKTSDGGLTWEPQTSGTSSTLYAVHFVDVNTGWVVGYKRTILKTSDGGLNWVSQYSTAPVTFLEDLHFMNADTGVAVGWEGSTNIFRTTDGGENWTGIDLGNAWVKDVYFLNDTVGWAAGITASYISVTDDIFEGLSINIDGAQSTLWKTIDGGLTWNEIIFPLAPWLYAVHFNDTSTGWVAGGMGIIMNTTDGGSTWDVGMSPSGNYQALQSIGFMNGSMALITGDGGTILRSINGGNSWNMVSGSGTNKTLRSVFSIDPSTAWAVGYNGKILRTINGGASWITQESGISYDLEDIFFINGNYGWAVSGYGKILNTTDGGLTWEKQTSETSDDLNSVFFADALHGWAAGENGTIISTSDGGVKWSGQSSDTSEWLYLVFFVDNLTGWIVGDRGIILNTKNGGTNWIPQSSSTERNLLAICFIDSNNGWIVGDMGTILHTEDGGMNWLPQESKTESYLVSVCFIDESVGWAVSNYGDVFKTADGGISWGSQPGATSGYFYDAHFINYSTGWMVGMNGLILKTEMADGTIYYSPFLAEPFDESHGLPLDTVLKWKSVDGAISYRVQVATNDYFFEPLIDQSGITDTILSLNNLDYSTGYRWRVSAEYSSGTSKWSATWTFSTVMAPPDAPEPNYPDNEDDLQALSPLFDWYTWHISNSADSYHLQISLDTDFINLVFDSTGIDSTNLYAGPLEYYTTYYWRVNAVNQGGESPYSAIQSFTTHAKGWNPQKSNIYSASSIHFSDINNGWITGLMGLICHTTDGGDNWVPLPDSTNEDIKDCWFVNNSTGWVVGTNGLIMNTTNGGSSLNIQYSGVTESLLSVHFVDVNSGWAVGNNGKILKTVNGGQQWFEQTSGKSSTLNSVFFVDNLTGWIAGLSNTLLKTVDGGENWVDMAGENDYFGFNSVFFVNNQKGWMAGYSGTLIKTTDGGDSWTQIYETLDQKYEFSEIYFLDSLMGWIVGYDEERNEGVLLKTTDGGNSWEKQIYGSSKDLNEVFFISPGIGWITGSKLLLLKTTTGGGGSYSAPVLTKPFNGVENVTLNPILTWEPASGAEYYELEVSVDSVFYKTWRLVVNETGITDNMVQVSGLEMYREYFWRVNAVYSKGKSTWSKAWKFSTIIATPDTPTLGSPWNYSGQQPLNPVLSWYGSITAKYYQVQIATDTGFSIIVFDSTGIENDEIQIGPLDYCTTIYWRLKAFNAAGASPFSEIWRFTTIAKGWISQESDFYGYFTSVYFNDINNGWVAGFNGAISRTTDGGDNWNMVTQATNENLEDVWFVDGLKGWAVGTNGAILNTVDGGLSWDDQISGITETLNSVQFVDENTGWAVGDGGKILKTIDGGQQWVEQTSGKSSELNSVFFIDNSTGWIAGFYNTLLKTVDGGENWMDVAGENNFGFLNSIFFINSLKGWIVGFSGSVFKTTDGGNTWNNFGVFDDNIIFEGIHFTDSLNGWLFGNERIEWEYNGILLKTVDGGESWEKQIYGTTDKIYSIFFITPQTGWLVFGSKILKTTTSGGESLITPMLAEPSDGAQDILVNPTLAWHAVPGALYYELQVSDYIKFYSLSIVFDQSNITDTFKFINGLDINREYYWRVNAVSTKGISLWSKTWSFRTGETTGIEDKHFVNNLGKSKLNSFCYPNPFNATTTIHFTVHAVTKITLQIFDVSGRKIETLLNENMIPGNYQISWTAERYPAGIYYYQIQAGEAFEIGKLILVK